MVLAPTNPMIRRTSRLLLVAVSSGLLFLGIGGRIAMRGLALAIGRPTNFGLGATAGIVLIGSVLGLVGGVLFMLIGRQLPSSGAIKGVLFGTLFFALLIPLQPAAVQEEIAAFRGHLLLATICFWVLFAGYGIMLSEIVARRDGRQTDEAPSIGQY
jgi:hypothetical protein